MNDRDVPMWSQIASHLHQIGISFFLPKVAKKGKAGACQNFNFQLKKSRNEK